MIIVIFITIVVMGIAFYLATTSVPDRSKYWEEKGRKEFMEDIHGKNY